MQTVRFPAGIRFQVIGLWGWGNCERSCAYRFLKRVIIPAVMAVESSRTPDESQTFSRFDQALPALALFGLFFVIITRRAWVGDDAYITFRTVDNLINGYALTWNAGERVQAYTHPLWMLLLSLFYFFTREIYFTSIMLSLALSLTAVGLLAGRISRSATGALLALVVLSLSNAFVDYSTSGLENPLTHLLLVIFALLLFGGENTPGRLFWLALTAALAGVNRLDTLLFYGPALLLTWWDLPQRKRGFRPALLGMLPLVGWELFSLVYYGFLFPNTAYAKLNTGVAGAELAAQGVFYLLHSLEVDPLTVLALGMGLAAAVILRERRGLALAAGMLLYLLYIIKIGGDFMSGRFLSAPLLAAVILLARAVPERLAPRAAAALFGVVLLVGLAAPLPTYRIDRPETVPVSDEKRINDERAWYFPDVGLLGRSRLNPYPTSQGRQGGLAARAQGEQDYTVIPVNNIGLYGFYAGPKVYIIDEYALADPLLARLPAEREANFYIGHFHRRVPDGYISTVYSGKNQLEDENLARYYDQLRLVVRGPLFSPARWAAIWKIHTGQLNGLIDQDRYRYPDMVRISVDQVELNLAGTVWARSEPVTFGDSGIEVRLDEPVKAARLVLMLDSAADFQVVYLNASAPDAEQVLTGSYATEKMSTYTLWVPAGAQAGFDRVRIFPLRGQEIYHLERLAVSE